ncbi:MAG: alpha-L-rhamnosidase N-terminal domain-containing protein [Gemmatimonadetes bacterium]|nr:alpha-L-rhamnosidase N-terminal domain-containing protein [Gemmatimonadota bacterium]
MHHLSRSRAPVRTLALGAAALAWTALAWAALPHRLEASAAQSWQARWIAAPGGAEGNTWHAFRHEIDLDDAPFRTVVRIAASDKYWLWVNGQMVVFEGQLKRGPSRSTTYYDTLDLAPHLREGRNTIAALVWYWGRSGYSHRSAGQAGFLFEADFGGRPLVSDAGWKARVLPAYQAAADPQPNGALTEQHVRYDARLAVPGWNQPGFDDSGWAPAVELGTPPIPPWNELVARPIPMWRGGGLQDYASLERGERGAVVARLPYNAQVTPYLRVRAPAGELIVMSTDTYVTARATTVRAEYVTREGVQEYESYGWMSGHEVRYQMSPAVEVLDLKYRETGYRADVEGSFRSDDGDLDALWTKARRTLQVNMRDNHMDTPDRERAQWLGDVVVQLGQVFYALDAQRGPLLARKAFRQMAAWQRDDGALLTPIPYGKGLDSPELPLQLLSAVGWYGLWSYYLHTGDEETLAAVYPAVREYLGLWEVAADGLVVHRPGDWAWADWGEHADYAVLENAWYHLALRGAKEVATVVGAVADTADYAERMRALEAAFRSRFWAGDHYRSPGHAGRVDDRSNALAVLAGLATPDQHSALLQVLLREEHASPYMEKYVLEAIFVLDGAEHAMARMKRRYGPQIRSWITTLWEDWEFREWNTYNHAWAGGPLTLLSRYAAGVAPAEPGWERYSLLPQMGSLREIAAVVPTPHGGIEVSLERGPGRVRVAVDAPVPGVLGVPVGDMDRPTVAVDGVDIWRDGAATPDSGEVRVLSADSRWIRLDVPAGARAVEASGPVIAPPEPVEALNLSENPVRSGRVVFNFSETPDVAAVFTLDGRRVVDLLRRMSEPTRAMWDLSNERGGRVAPGIYLVVARVGDELVRRRLIIP